jgi:hypothetical protein
MQLWGTIKFEFEMQLQRVAKEKDEVKWLNQFT